MKQKKKKKRTAVQQAKPTELITCGQLLGCLASRLFQGWHVLFDHPRYALNGGSIPWDVSHARCKNKVARVQG